MTDITYQQVSKDRLDEAVNLAVLCFGEEWRSFLQSDYSTAFENPVHPSKLVCAFSDGKIIAVLLSLNLTINMHTQSFSGICVHPDFRNRQIGSRLISYSEELEVNGRFEGKSGTFILVDGSASKIYERLGYKDVFTTHNGEPLRVKNYMPSAA